MYPWLLSFAIESDIVPVEVHRPYCSGFSRKPVASHPSLEDDAAMEDKNNVISHHGKAKAMFMFILFCPQRERAMMVQRHARLYRSQSKVLITC